MVKPFSFVRDGSPRSAIANIMAVVPHCFTCITDWLLQKQLHCNTIDTLQTPKGST